MSNLKKYEDLLKNSSIQKEMHLPSGKPNDLNDKNNHLYSIHGNSKKKTLWYRSSWESMSSSNVPTNPDLVTYRSKMFPFHALHKSILTTITPKIKAKKDYEIRFCDNLFVSMIKEFRLFFNDTELQFGNEKSLFFHTNLCENRKRVFEELGNKESLTSWCDVLDQEEISISLPWFYSKDKSSSFPLNYCGHNDRLEHSVEFSLNLENLILIRNKDGDIVPFSKDLLEVTGNVESLPVPEMEGLYTTVTSQECEYGNCVSNNEAKEIFVENIYYIEDENEVELGKKIKLKIDSKNNFPTHSIFWGAYNLTLSEKEKTPVFHFNSSLEKLSPIKTSKIESSVGIILDSKSSYKTEKSFPLLQFKKTPFTPGLNLWKNSVLLEDDPRKFTPGIKIGGGSLHISLKDTSYECSNKFNIFLILNHTRKFRFASFPRNEEERLKVGATIQLVEE